MKIGDPYTARVDNKTPDGLTVSGQVTDFTPETVTISTQFGIRMTLPRPPEPVHTPQDA